MEKNQIADVKIGLLLFLSCMAAYGAHADRFDTPLYLDETASMEIRVEDALSRMTLQEKIAMIHADSKFSTAGCPRLGIPALRASDGPQGVREELMWDKWDSACQTNDSCTAYPSLMSVAATWNRDMAYLYGKSIGEEFRYRGKDIALTPGVNIYRHPLCGRNFEYMGEDPFLAGEMAVEAIRGIQLNGVAACVKHFALNNQEMYRHDTDVVLSDRALHEIYLPAFRKSVRKGNVWTVMGAYNKYKGEYCCHNSRLNSILKDDWGFDGVFLSDWGGAIDTRQAVRNGLDLEFGTFTDGLGSGLDNAYDNYFLASPYLQMIQSGEVGTSELDDKVRRVLRLCFRTNMNRNRPFGSMNSPRHSEDALEIQREGIVLLKNRDGILPIDHNKYRRILVVGENADFMLTRWGGSSNVKARYETTPLQAMRSAWGDGVSRNWRKGYTSDWPPNRETQDSLMVDAVRDAETADLIIFIGGHNKYPNHDTESYDRISAEAPFRQGELLEKLVKMKKRIVLVTMGADMFDMPYADGIDAMVHAWYGGSESGTALLDVLDGRVNPSGKLPVTFYRSLEDCGAIACGEYPGDGKRVHYNEDIFVGYRYVDRTGVKPAFPFGHGLSYTRFGYGRPSVDRKVIAVGDSVSVSVPVTNIGNREGKETVQLYVSDVESSLPRPVKELKGFAKINLSPGETGMLRFILTPEDFSYYDDRNSGWIEEPGKFRLLFGSSSADIRQELEIEVR